MSLFNKIEVNPNMIPFIEDGEGVGIVKVDGYGKSSARIESYKLILESYDDKHPIIESLTAINYLSYKEGNFFNEPKLEIGVAHKKYILAGVENNDDELEAFYNTLLDIKNNEKQDSSSNRGLLTNRNKSGIGQTSSQITSSQIDRNVKEDETTSNDTTDELDDLEKELSDDDFESEIKSNEKPKRGIGLRNRIKNELNSLKDGLLYEDDEEENGEDVDEIVDLEKEIATDEAVPENKSNDVHEMVEKESKKSSDVVETFDIVDKDDEEFEVLAEISEDDLTGENNEEKSVDNEISDEEDEDIEFDEIVLSNELNDNKSSNELIIEEADEDIMEESSGDEIEIIDDLDEEDIELDRVITQPKAEAVNSVEEPQIEEKIEVPQKQAENVQITKENASEEISKMKEELSQNLDDISSTVSDNHSFPQYVPTVTQVDPVDQIRRYHELKEEGIITEEEFEQKKKQILDL